LPALGCVIAQYNGSLFFGCFYFASRIFSGEIKKAALEQDQERRQDQDRQKYRSSDPGFHPWSVPRLRGHRKRKA
jgi:hypothetical protein